MTLTKMWKIPRGKTQHGCGTHNHSWQQQCTYSASKPQTTPFVMVIASPHPCSSWCHQFHPRVLFGVLSLLHNSSRTAADSIHHLSLVGGEKVGVSRPTQRGRRRLHSPIKLSLSTAKMDFLKSLSPGILPFLPPSLPSKDSRKGKVTYRLKEEAPGDKFQPRLCTQGDDSFWITLSHSESLHFSKHLISWAENFYIY